jgi:hypothetical protein
MADNIITNANDVELVIKEVSPKAGAGEGDDTSVSSRNTASAARFVVDEFTITREEDDSLVSGVSRRLPNGFTNGDVVFNWDFTMMGDDVEVFQIVTSSDGTSNRFTMVARKYEDGDSGTLSWEYTLSPCKATSDEFTATSGDPTEKNISGIAAGFERKFSTSESGG